jgi:hypothetical protein
MWTQELINPYLEICHFEVLVSHFVTQSHVTLEVFMARKINFGVGSHWATSRTVAGSRPDEVNFFDLPNIYFYCFCLGRWARVQESKEESSGVLWYQNREEQHRENNNDVASWCGSEDGRELQMFVYPRERLWVPRQHLSQDNSRFCILMKF